MINNEAFFQYYNVLFLLLSYLVLLFSIRLDIKGGNRLAFKVDTGASLIFILACILLVGLRAYDVGTDTGNYYNKWLRFEDFEFGSDFLFYLLMFAIQKIGANYQIFLLAVSGIYFGGIYIAYKRLSKIKEQSILLLVFSFLALFFSLTTSINVIRQGLSLVFLILAYSNFLNGNKKGIIIGSIIALSFHLTAIIPILLFFLTISFKRVKLSFFVILYFFGLIITYMDYGIKDIAPFLNDLLISMEDKRLTYLADKRFDRYILGFKPQFAVFNTVFLLIFLFVNKNIDRSEQYATLLKYFILSSFIFFMAFQLPFSDRWGLFSWFFIPALLGPIFSFEKKGRINLRTLSAIFLIFVFLFFNVFYQ